MPQKAIHRCLSAMARWTTAFHLWCAEHELRQADVRWLPTRLQTARRRNLDLLGRYRRRGEFPRNTYDRGKAIPCFMDDEGRQCAVAFLMHRTGGQQAADQVRKNANLARIRDMQEPGLVVWKNKSGLSQADLARIQPKYAPSAEFYGWALGPIWIVGALAANSIAFNLGRLVWTHRPRRTTAALGFVAGIFLLAYIDQIDMGRRRVVFDPLLSGTVFWGFFCKFSKTSFSDCDSWKLAQSGAADGGVIS